MVQRFRGGRRRRSPARRIGEFVAVFALLSGVALLAAILDEQAMRTVAGMARIADGDTLVFAGERVRLAGIDAPELGQTCESGAGTYACGREARRFLAGLLEQGETVCRGNEEDRYGRLLVRCVCGTTDVNAAMVRAGWAVSYGGYESEERLARADGAGLWGGTFERPGDWRAMRGSAADLGPAGMVRRIINRVAGMIGMLDKKDE